jgi:SAM-dependent methyltransferase
MNSIIEPFKPDPATLKLIEKFGREIAIDNPEIQGWFADYFEGHKHRIAFDYDMVKKYACKDSIIVEVGATPYLLTIPLMQEYKKVISIDIAPERFNKTIQKFQLEVRKCDIEREPLPLEDNFSDVIIFNEIFEHLRINLIFTMREVFRIIKPGGLLLLSTPNLRSLSGIKNFLFRKTAQSGCWDIYEQYEKLVKLGHMGHVREYTSVEVYAFLRKTGFNIESIIYRGKYQSTMDNWIIKIRPNLRPYFSCIAKKPC